MRSCPLGFWLGGAVMFFAVGGRADPDYQPLAARCGPLLDKASQSAFRLYVQRKQASGTSGDRLVKDDAECQRRMRKHPLSGGDKAVRRLRFILDADVCVPLFAIWVRLSDEPPSAGWQQMRAVPGWFPAWTSFDPRIAMPINYHGADFSERREPTTVGGVFSANSGGLHTRIEGLLRQAVDTCLSGPR